MKIASGPTFITSLNAYSSETVQTHDLGQMAQTSDGRKFRYSKANGTTVTGDCYGSAGQDAQFQSMANTAIVAIGGTSIAVTNGTTTVAANDFDEGYLLISSSVGIGQSSQIVSHDTGTSGATITYQIADPLAVALSTASKVTVIKNPFDDVIIQAVTPVAPAVGISQFAIPTTKFGWIQTGGAAAALFDASVCAVDTLGVAGSTTTAGAVRVAAAATEYIGVAMQVVPVSAYVCPIFLTID